MRYLIVLSVVLVSLGVAGTAHAGECRDLAIKGDYTRALAVCRKAAETGDPSVQHVLGVMYFQGLGVTQDDAEAMKWFRRAAEQGFAKSQNGIGVMYAFGQGVAQDYAEAVKWYRKSAEQGYAQAQYNLGVMYDKGQGVPQNKVQTYMWVSLAAARRDKEAKWVVDELAAEMTSAQIAEAQKIAWEWEKKHAGPIRSIDFEPESGFVVIDRSHSAYTVFTGILKESSEQELDEIKSKISNQEKVVIVTWAKFIDNAHKYANSTIVKHEYMKYGVVDGIVCLIGKAPGAPWGLTWNGGVALTWNDYRHAREAYQLYQKDPKKYEQAANRDPRADPINPGGHLPAFGCY